MTFLSSFLAAFLDLWLQSAPYLLLGFGIAGLLHTFLPPARVAAWLGEKSPFAVLRAALIGVPLPLCSCSVVPVAAQLRRSGAGRGATTAFLISTPETGVDSIAITYALTDPIMTIARPIGAFFSATVGGYLQNWLNPEAAAAPAPIAAPVGGSCCSAKKAAGEMPASAADKGGSSAREPSTASKSITVAKRVALAAQHGFGTLLGTLALYLVVGFLIAAAITVALEHFEPLRLALASPWAMLWMLLAGVPMYVCASSATPLVAVLIAQGLSPGAGLVFLMSGPATNAATIVVLRQMLGTRGVAIYLAAIAGSAVLCGFALNAVYAALGGPHFAHAHHAAHEHGATLNLLSVASGIVLAALIVAALWRRYAVRSPRVEPSPAPAGSISLPVRGASQITLATARNGMSGTR